MKRIVCAATLTCAATALAAQNGDPAAGEALAETWCSSCHVVSGDVTGSDTGPSFGSIAGRMDSAGQDLRAWIMAPHNPMPQLDLTDEQIENILAYIRTLATE